MRLSARKRDSSGWDSTWPSGARCWPPPRVTPAGSGAWPHWVYQRREPASSSSTSTIGVIRWSQWHGAGGPHTSVAGRDNPRRRSKTPLSTPFHFVPITNSRRLAFCSSRVTNRRLTTMCCGLRRCWARSSRRSAYGTSPLIPASIVSGTCFTASSTPSPTRFS